MADGFTVDRSALRETAQGINDTLGALEKLGFNEEAGVGRGFSGLALSGLQVGDAGLQSAFSGFCDRWSWGVRTLVQDGNQFAQRLGLSAGVYADTESYLSGVIKVAVNAAWGDPHLSNQQVENESYGTIFSAWKPSMTLTSQERQEMDQINSSEVKDIKGGPWWLQAAKTADKHLH